MSPLLAGLLGGVAGLVVGVVIILLAERAAFRFPW
jgi:ABC-type lipoprotein release transport system permease subunit